MKSNYSIENLIRQSETEKELPVSPLFWNRLERRLEKPSRRSASWRYIASLAASVLFLAGAVYLYSLKSHAYLLEDLNVSEKPHFSKHELEGIEQYYASSPLSSVLNG